MVKLGHTGSLRCNVNPDRCSKTSLCFIEKCLTCSQAKNPAKSVSSLTAPSEKEPLYSSLRSVHQFWLVFLEWSSADSALQYPVVTLQNDDEMSQSQCDFFTGNKDSALSQNGERCVLGLRLICWHYIWYLSTMVQIIGTPHTWVHFQEGFKVLKAVVCSCREMEWSND